MPRTIRCVRLDPRRSARAGHHRSKQASDRTSSCAVSARAPRRATRCGALVPRRPGHGDLASSGAAPRRVGRLRSTERNQRESSTIMRRLSIAALAIACGCDFESELAPREAVPVIIDGSGMASAETDLGYIVQPTRCRTAIADIEFTTDGEKHA